MNYFMQLMKDEWILCDLCEHLNTLTSTVLHTDFTEHHKEDALVSVKCEEQ